MTEMRFKWYAHTEEGATCTTVKRYCVDYLGRPAFPNASAMVLRFPGRHSMLAARFARALNELEQEQENKDEQITRREP